MFWSAAPALAATITVTSAEDVAGNDGRCTLREAIGAANSNTASGAAPGECAAGAAGLDIIQFNVSGTGRSGGACTIAPNPALPAVTGPVLLDATTQPGYSGSPLIRIDWTVPAGGNGLPITGGCTVKGLSITHFSSAIVLTTNGNNTIQGNWLGLDRSGAAAGNGCGVEVDGSSNNVIGGTTALQRNVISFELLGRLIPLESRRSCVCANAATRVLRSRPGWASRRSRSPASWPAKVVSTQEPRAQRACRSIPERSPR